MYYIHDAFGIELARSQSKHELIEDAKTRTYPCTVDKATKKDPVCELIHAHKPNHPSIGGLSMDRFIQSARSIGSNFSTSK